MAELNAVSPAILMSFWRCGSNFVANVVCKSCGKLSETMYNPELPLVAANLEEYIFIKSHAPSYPHLLAELGAFCPNFPGLPHKFVVVWRDPRDMMISFHDWLSQRHQWDIPQQNFLHDLRYGYAVAGMGHISLLDAFRIFVRSWRAQRELHNMRSYKFEELLADKEGRFLEMLKFLGREEPIATKALEEKVKLGRSNRKERGVTAAWRKYGDRYAVLIDEVNQHFAAEMELLGYNGEDG